ncbi:MAG: Ku protein [Parvibaculaceae bacterium]
MPRGRAMWKGHLRLSLVSIPVELYNAVESAASITFNQIHKPTGKRISYSKTVAGIGEVNAEDIVKGYAVDKDTYVLIEPKEIEAVKVESRKTIELKEFVDFREIDARFIERPYYLVPQEDEGAAEGYLVIKEALERSGKVGLGQITMGGREHLIAVAPVGRGLVVEMLRYANEVRPERSYFGEIPDLDLDEEMVELASQIITRKDSKFDPSKYEDTYAVALQELVAKKAKGQKITAPTAEPRPSGTNVIDLMSALKRSLEKGKDKEKGPAKSPPSKKKPPAKKRARG